MRVWLGHTGVQLEGSLHMCQVVKPVTGSRAKFRPKNCFEGPGLLRSSR